VTGAVAESSREDLMRTNQRLAQLWLNALTTELAASADTIDTYTDDLDCYLTSLDENSFCLNDIGLEKIWLHSPFLLLRRLG
jgi:site-specific recombinase XerD